METSYFIQLFSFLNLRLLLRNVLVQFFIWKFLSGNEFSRKWKFMTKYIVIQIYRLECIRITESLIFGLYITCCLANNGR